MLDFEVVLARCAVARDGHKWLLTQMADTYFTTVSEFYPFPQTLANPRLKLL